MRTIGVIPARLHSTRLPRKLLLEETGKPLIQHTWEQAVKAQSLDGVIVAADSPAIAEAVRRFGGWAELTGEHSSGTDRVAEVARRCCSEAEIIVNIQGDEPEIDPAHIDRLVESLAAHPESEMATLAAPLDPAERDDPGCVKVVCAATGGLLGKPRSALEPGQSADGCGRRHEPASPAADGRALYFSRAPIPFVRDPENASGSEHVGPHANANSPWLLHLGIYAYRVDFLLRLTELPPSRLEGLEKLEQLRALEAGATIRVAVVEHRAVGIDTPEDYDRFVRRCTDRAA